MSPQDFVPRTFHEFDVFLAGLIGRYLGGTITAEELGRRAMSARSDGLRANIFPWPRPGQEWFYLGVNPTTPEDLVQGDLEFFCPDYTNGPAPEVVSDYDPGEYPEAGLRRRIAEDWVPQLEANYGPGIVTVVEPDRDYLARRSGLAGELADIHRRYLDGRLAGMGFSDSVQIHFRLRRDAEDVHHYEFEASIWDAGCLATSVIDEERDEFAYDGRGPARRRLDAIMAAFPGLSQ